MSTRLWLSMAALGFAAFGAAAQVNSAIPVFISNAVADSHRPPEQSKLDDARKPAKVIAFAGVKPGGRVADFMPGNAYFTRILSKIVGPTGRVYAFTPNEQIKNCDPTEIAGSRAIENNPNYRNVVHLSAPVNQFSVPEKLDLIWTAQNYHDLHDSFLGPADIKRVNKNFFESLKPGGVLIVIDHAAVSGSGLRDTEKLHRIDPGSVREEVEAAGFVFDARIDDLNNSDDDHSLPVFDPSIRGRTDQFVYKFRKPDMPR
jgi:predicted methyltransferase